jgi:HEAT repeat protein
MSNTGFWLDLTRDKDPKVRRRAVQALCSCNVRSNNERVWDRILEMIADDDPKVRSIVLHVLCDGSPRSREAQVLAALDGLQRDSDIKLRRQARNILARYRRTGKINKL